MSRIPIKPQRASTYARLPALLRTLRDEAGLTQRELGERLRKPQSWVHNCEIAARRVDIAEFVLWVEACGIDPLEGVRRYLLLVRKTRD